ncbi:hypothetical protein ACLOJK_026713 [Asimina triloba]
MDGLEKEEIGERRKEDEKPKDNIIWKPKKFEIKGISSGAKDDKEMEAKVELLGQSLQHQTRCSIAFNHGCYLPVSSDGTHPDRRQRRTSAAPVASSSTDPIRHPAAGTPDDDRPTSDLGVSSVFSVHDHTPVRRAAPSTAPRPISPPDPDLTASDPKSADPSSSSTGSSKDNRCLRPPPSSAPPDPNNKVISSTPAAATPFSTETHSRPKRHRDPAAPAIQRPDRSVPI